MVFNEILQKWLKILKNLESAPQVTPRTIKSTRVVNLMEQFEGIQKQCLGAILIKYVVFYGISLKPCNSGSGYNPTLWILQCSTDFTEDIGASLVSIAHCSEQL